MNMTSTITVPGEVITREVTDISRQARNEWRAVVRYSSPAWAEDQVVTFTLTNMFGTLYMDDTTSAAGRVPISRPERFGRSLSTDYVRRFALGEVID